MGVSKLIQGSRTSLAICSGCSPTPRRSACIDRRERTVLVRASTSNDLGLVKKERQGDGSVLFVFGNESEKQQQTPDKQPSESTSAPSAQAAAPVQQDPTPPPATASQSTPQTSSSKPPAHAKAAAPETSEEPEATAFVSVAAGGPESNGKNAPSAGEAVEIDLASLKVQELKKIAKEKNLTGISKYKKEQLVDAISQASK